MRLLIINLNRWWINILTFLTLVLIGLFDWYTGHEISLYILYLIPLIFYTNSKHASRNVIILYSLLSGTIWFFADYYADHIYSNPLFPYWNAIIRILTFIGISLMVFSIRKKQQELGKLNAKLNEYNHVLSVLNAEVTVKNELFTNSITYAQTIQNALLPSRAKIGHIFNDFFVINKPKNIVSGDFYWYYETRQRLLIAVADCTGHGVPGAFMSIIGNVLLNNIIIERKIFTPSEILKRLSKEIYNLLARGDKPVSDGMEISILGYERDEKKVYISQSNQKVILVTPSGKLLEIEGNKYSLGGILSMRKKYDFKDTVIDVEEETLIYMFTDGFIDQFGGLQDTKFGLQQFREMIKDNYGHPLARQSEIFETINESWKSKGAQTDDILLIGLKV